MPTFRGKPACQCLVEWLPVYEAELLRLGVIKHSLDLWQLIGGATASAGTHAGGGAFDDAQYSDKALQIAREMGAAKWKRTRAQGFDMDHGHGVLNGCPHAAASAKAQVQSYKNGRNGLANNGRDDGPKPRQFPTWQDGIKWAKARQAPAVKPAIKPIKPWFNAAFLNTAGNNKTLSVSAAKRSGTFADDVTAGSPAVIGFCEIRSDQIEDLTLQMARRGYKRAAHSHMLAVFVREHVVIRGYSFAKYKKQGKGSTEGMLRVKLTIDGSRCQVGVTHLDYPANSTAVRVAQMKDGIASLKRYGIVTLLPDWKSRTVILADINDSTGAVIKAAKSLGFVDAGAGASIDKILVGSKRKMRGASKHSTTSDHPIVKAKLGKS